MERQLEVKVKTIRSDNGGEFTSNAMTEYLLQRGIEHQLVPPAAHAQNARVERVHLTIMDGVRTLLAPKRTWLVVLGRSCTLHDIHAQSITYWS